MPVSIIGINHKTAPIAVREKVAFTPSEIKSAIISLKGAAQLDEVVIISTCNRMEIIYRSHINAASGEVNSVANGTEINLDSKGDSISEPVSNELEQEKIRQKILLWLADYHQLETTQVEPHCYLHDGHPAIIHLMSVACGLDSMVLGEPQILGQVKDAYGYANHAGSIGLYLNRLFQQTFSLAKQVRTDTQIGESAVSVAYAAITLAKRIFSDFSQVTVLFIGAGETIELAARHLVRQGVVDIHVANRTVERAQLLAGEFDGVESRASSDSKIIKISAHAHSLAALPELVVKADIVISSTASPIPIIGKGLMEKTIVARKHRSMFMVDLAVPRDIEAEVANLNDVYLYTVDDMQDVIQENLKLREEAALEAKDIVSLHTEKYLAWLQSLSSVSLLKEFRTHFEQVKSDEVRRAISKLELQLGEGMESQEIEKIISEMATRLAKKFMHKPSQSIRQAGENSDRKALEVLSDAFGIEGK